MKKMMIGNESGEAQLVPGDAFNHRQTTSSNLPEVLLGFHILPHMREKF
jgi:hypothetical protein